MPTVTLNDCFTSLLVIESDCMCVHFQFQAIFIIIIICIKNLNKNGIKVKKIRIIHKKWADYSKTCTVEQRPFWSFYYWFLDKFQKFGFYCHIRATYSHKWFHHITLIQNESILPIFCNDISIEAILSWFLVQKMLIFGLKFTKGKHKIGISSEGHS